MDYLPDIEQCLQTLEAGGIILYPTDTIWGLGCDATNEKAVERIFALKRRPEHKGMIVLVADPGDILHYTSQSDPRILDYLQKAQKPTTVIYQGVVNLATNLSVDGTIAIRVVNDEFCKHLIKRLGRPIVSTSPNRSGDPPPLHFDSIGPDLRAGADYIVQYRRSDNSSTEPSAVVYFNPDGSVRVIRP